MRISSVPLHFNRTQLFSPKAIASGVDLFLSLERSSWPPVILSLQFLPLDSDTHGLSIVLLAGLPVFLSGSSPSALATPGALVHG